MFSGKLSPVATAPPSTDRILNLYSRHSRDNSQVDLEQMANSHSTPSNRKVSADETNSAGAGFQLTSTPTQGGSGVTEGASDLDGGGQELSISPRTRAALQLDLLVHEHPPVKTSETEEVTKVIATGDSQPNCDDDRVVEFENPGDTESSSEPLTTETSSSVPVGDEDEGMKYVLALGWLDLFTHFTNPFQKRQPSLFLITSAIFIQTSLDPITVVVHAPRMVFNTVGKTRLCVNRSDSLLKEH